MRVAVIGGTGSVGRLVVDELVGRGDEVRVLSRRPPESPLGEGSTHHPIDLADGSGLAAALEGVETVVDAANDPRAARKVMVDGTGRLLSAVAKAGVGHHVLISIIGCDRLSFGYYRAKVAQEDLVADGPIPWSILRASQFHTLLDGLFSATARFGLIPTGAARIQPVDPAVVAARLAALAHEDPGGRVPQIAGPQVETLGELAHAWRKARGRRSMPVRVPVLGRSGSALRGGALCDVSAAAGGPTFGEWLAG